MNVRERILQRLRQAPAIPCTAPDIDSYRPLTPPGPTQAHYLQSLQRNLEAAHAEVHAAHGADWPQKVAQICAAKGVRTLMLPPAGIDLAPWPQGPQLARFDRALEDHKEALFNEVDAGLTRADCAIADTGMLVLLSSPTQPRTLSLVPPINICLVDTDRIHADLPSALRAGNWAAGMPTNLIFISGPSKTADIQQTLAYGAHGPKELIVILTSGSDRGAV
jgi:L-lactate dehydrogenase complex protein LldG